VGHVARMGEKINACEVFVRKYEGKGPFKKTKLSMGGLY
jgi:hypothetical protein